MIDKSVDKSDVADWFDARSRLRAELRYLQRTYNYTQLEIINIAMQAISELTVSAVRAERAELAELRNGEDQPT